MHRRWRIGAAWKLLSAAVAVSAYLPPVTASGQAAPSSHAPASPILSQQVVVRRTEYGVPHIKAESLGAAFFALGYCQMEDYGEEVVRRLIESRGESARYLGEEGDLESDLLAKRAYTRAVETYHLLPQDVRNAMEGFAAGVNLYIEGHADALPEWVRPDFNGHDVAARDIGTPGWRVGRRVLENLGVEAVGLPPTDGTASEDGSNAWAFAPGRTVSGRTILLRNPHLRWTAGYYEAHITVPGVLNFYGDFRVGGPFGIIGGFNDYLGWATTNNSPALDVVYELVADPARSGQYLFDGASIPLRQRTLTAEVMAGESVQTESQQLWETPLGPVIHRGEDRIYVLRSTNDGEFRRGEQFLRMMQATALEEWLEAMGIRALQSSNLTYADGAGNIFYVWNAKLPVLPHAPNPKGATPARKSADVWTRLVPFDDLPRLLNPAGGYVQNSNDPPYYTNLNQPLNPDSFPPNMPAPRLRFRSQLSLDLVHNEAQVTLEEVVRMKHDVRMVLAERVKADLVEAVRSSNPEEELAQAAALLESWDGTVDARSRGSALFELWATRYLAVTDSAAQFRLPWSSEEPTLTPSGLGDPSGAVEALRWALDEAAGRWGSWDVAWGEVHRVRRGSVDVPVGGCSSSLGCFRVLNYDLQEDGRYAASGGDGWILAVEFGEPPRAYSVLAYGQSNREDSPHFDDQAAMFARGELKPVAFAETEVEARTIRTYRPREE